MYFEDVNIAKKENDVLISLDDILNISNSAKADDNVVTKQPRASSPRTPEVVCVNPWKHELFDFWKDIPLCIRTFICPCNTLAQNAGYFYEDERNTKNCYCPFSPTAMGAVMRWRIRQHKKIKGSMLKDILVHLWCTCCALIQENRELFEGEEEANN